jgi:hypothetical protein
VPAGSGRLVRALRRGDQAIPHVARTSIRRFDERHPIREDPASSERQSGGAGVRVTSEGEHP